MGYFDMHSHILPQMDDGAKYIEETLKMLDIAYREGITHIIATPHYKSGRYPADARKLRNSLHRVQLAARERNIPVTLYAGNEIFYNSELEAKLQSGALCTMNGTQYVLIEFSPLERYLYIRNAMEDLLGMGYFPILAHAERYQCLCQDISCVKELKAMGCELQVNAGSVTGDNGWKVKRLVRRLLKEELVDYIGTDAHNTAGRKPAMKKCSAYLYRKCRRSYADALLYGNARKRLT